MNYQHRYHAGNFADVMKHILLVQLLQQLGQKDKPFMFLDSHAGEGIYDLSKSAAQKSGEFLQGIHRLVQLSDAIRRQAPATIQHYLHQVEALRQLEGKGAYPGSIWWALQNIRAHDRAIALELEPRAFTSLQQHIRDPRAGLHQRDAYEGINAMIPPKEKRGVVFIDPPYEMERKDFPTLVELLTKLYNKWPTGVFVLWYPIKDRAQIDRFYKKMMRTEIKKQLICELTVKHDDIQGMGLSGSGLLIINPPYQFADHADNILQWLFPHLRQQQDAGHAVVRWLTGE